MNYHNKQKLTKQPITIDEKKLLNNSTVIKITVNITLLHTSSQWENNFSYLNFNHPNTFSPNTQILARGETKKCLTMPLH